MREAKSLPKLIIFGDSEKQGVSRAIEEFVDFAKDKSEILAHCTIEDIKNSFIKNVDLYHHQDPNVDLSGIDVSLGVTHEWLNKLASNESSELSSEVFDKWPINNLVLIEEIEEDFIAALKPVNV